MRKVIFFRGASRDDPQGLFNSGQDAKSTRSIDFGKEDELPETALKELIRAAAAYNLAVGKKKSPGTSKDDLSGVSRYN